MHVIQQPERLGLQVSRRVASTTRADDDVERNRRRDITSEYTLSVTTLSIISIFIVYIRPTISSVHSVSVLKNEH